MRKIWLLSSLALALSAQSQRNDSLIVPGVRVGPVTRISTAQSLLRTLGNLAAVASIGVGEGVEEPGLVLYPADPRRRLEIAWNHDQPPHPAMVFICPGINDDVCQWHTIHGIGIGATLRELEARNVKPFQMMVWGTDVGGNLVSLQGGRLEKELSGLSLTLVPRIDRDGQYLPKLTNSELDEVMGEKSLPSTRPVLRKLNPYIGAMTLLLSIP